MCQEDFMLPNKVFNGCLHMNKQKGFDVKHTHKETLTEADLAKLYDDYFLPNFKTNPHVLQHKVYFEIAFTYAEEVKKFCVV